MCQLCYMLQLRMAYIDPSVNDFKAYFNRDFPYSNVDLTTVNDADITKALNQQQNVINQSLFPTQNIYATGALLLSAHYLVTNLRASSQGIAGKYDWLTNSKSVSSVSSASSIPERLLENPEFSFLCGTNYGTQYLMIILPLLTGQMFSVYGPRPEYFNYFGGVYGSVGPWGGGDGPA